MKQLNVAILGVGMMGGSIGLAIKKRKLSYRVIGLGRNLQKLNRAKKMGAVNEISTDFFKGLKDADLVVICTPVFQIVPMVKKILPFLKRAAVITDIGSVKSPILTGVQEVFDSRLMTHDSRPTFVGSHPLCGSEKTGVENANSDLYQGAAVVICPSENRKAALAVQNFWKSLGAKPLILEPEIHDILVAQTSHLPHILASAFVQQISGLNSRDSNTKKLLAGSFRDFTRIVDSDSSQWAEIASANKKFIIGAIKSYRDILQRLLTKMETSRDSVAELEAFFTSAKTSREQLWKKPY